MFAGWCLVPLAVGQIACAELTAQGAPGIQLAYRDTTCSACQLFYEYANGSWIRSAPPPLANGERGTIEELNDRREAALVRILDSLHRARPPRGSVGWKLKEFFDACNDASAIESLGVQPIAAEIRRIDRIASLNEFQQEVARLHRAGVAPLFQLQALPDAKDSRQVVADLMPFGLGLGDREPYLRTDTSAILLLRRYATQIERTLQLAGVPESDARGQAESVLTFESRLAGWSLSMMDRMDPAALAHSMTVRELDQEWSEWSWEAYFRDMGRPDLGSANVEEPIYFRELGRALHQTSLSDLKAYLRWRYTAVASRSLGGRLVDSLVGGYGRGHLKTQAPAARQRFCVGQTEQRLGWLLGGLYAADAFPPAARAKANAMVQNIRTVLAQRIDSLDWMSPAAKREARSKLASFVVQVGYPDKWPDYSAVQVNQDRYWDDVVAANEYETRLELAKIGRAPSVNNWWPGYWPQTNDAYFNLNLNEIVLAAGYLQPPMFDLRADDATNYGGIGVVIAHEMTHAFDDRGRKFDSRANLRDWWTATDEVAFADLSQRVIAQYDHYLVVDTLHINGHQTLSENLADIGGVQLAYAAFENSLGVSTRAPVAGLTPEQRFFIAYAQSRRGVFDADFLRDKLAHNNHSPDKWRVIGALTNMPEFARAFACRLGDAMVAPPPARVRVW